jgi:signal peptidase I
MKKSKREKHEKLESQQPAAAGPLPGGIPVIWALAAALVISLACYILLKSVVFGAAAFIAIIALIIYDVIPTSAGRGGIASTLVEAGTAVVAAVIAWFLLGFVLSTPSPLDVVTSCSMVPNLERGDMVVLQGGAISSREVTFSGEIPLIKIVKEKCMVVGSSIAKEAACSSAVIVGNETIALKDIVPKSDTIVFEPEQQEYGYIIHRALLKLKNADTGEAFYLTKGDNNLAFDQESGISIVKEKNIKGRVVFRVPYAGYVKLIMFLQLQEPEGCEWRVEHVENQ